jgi:hypothetical protein
LMTIEASDPGVVSGCMKCVKATRGYALLKVLSSNFRYPSTLYQQTFLRRNPILVFGLWCSGTT